MVRRLPNLVLIAMLFTIPTAFGKPARAGELSKGNDTESKIVREQMSPISSPKADTLAEARGRHTIVSRASVSDSTSPGQNFVLKGTFLRRSPLRDYIANVGLQPGLFQLDGNLYVRGSTPEQNSFLVNGVNVTNLLYGEPGTHITPEAVEGARVYSGGYSAEYGDALGGIISTRLRTGGRKLRATLRLETDNYTGQGKSSLGGYSYGYSDYVATIGGPLVTNKIRFFVAAENEFYRDPGILSGTTATPLFWSGLGYISLATDPQVTLAHPDYFLSDTLNLNCPGGNRIGGQFNNYTYTGTLLFDLGKLKLEAAGSYSYAFSQDEAGIEDMFDTERLPVNRHQGGFGTLTLTHFLSPETYYQLGVTYFRSLDQTGLDPALLTDFADYGSPASNPPLNNGSSFLVSSPWTIFGSPEKGGVTVYQPGTLLATNPTLNSQTSIGTRLDFSTTVDKNRLTIGGEYTYSTIRHFATNVPTVFYSIINDNSLNDLQKETSLLQYTRNYGYDAFGHAINSDIAVGPTRITLGPPHPVIGAVYIRDEIALPDVSLDIGLRYDYFNLDSWTFERGITAIRIDSFTVFSSNSIANMAPTTQLSPRLAFSFRAGDKTTISARYGRFIQEPALAQVYFGMGIPNPLTDTLNYGLRPERSTLYEVSLSQAISENASINITGFYKEMTDLIQVDLLAPWPISHFSFPTLVNRRSATSEGLEVTVMLRRTRRVEGEMNFTFSNAKYSPASWGNISVDYRFEEGDGGPILERSGVDLLLQYVSGYPYSVANPAIPAGRTYYQQATPTFSTPGTLELDARIDKTVRAGPVDVMFYIYAINLLNTKEAENVFAQTGNPADNGWLSSAAGEAYAAGMTDPSLYRDLYTSAYLGNNSGNFRRPRQIRFGMEIKY